MYTQRQILINFLFRIAHFIKSVQPKICRFYFVKPYRYIENIVCIHVKNLDLFELRHVIFTFSSVDLKRRNNPPWCN
jgi:hypothetical protein